MMALLGSIAGAYSASVLDLAFRPDRTRDVPLSRQLADHVATLVAAGRLDGGARLPPTREVAAALGLARNTVAAAYAELTTRGLLQAHVGRGTFVVATGAPPPAAPPSGASPTPAGREFGWSGLLSRAAHAARVPAAFRRSELDGPFPFDFRGGRVDPALLPAGDLRWAFARPFQTRATLQALAGHRDPWGWPPLRRAVARRLADRAMRCTADDVAIVGGLQQAIDLTARALVDPGDAVVVEQPGYFGAAFAFAGRGADVLGVEVDARGLRTDRLARLLRTRRVKLIHVTPAAQSPTGVPLADDRRAELLALADAHQVPVLEDDYDSELRWSGPLRPTLKADDRGGHVVYAGTFSKVLFPGLRLGFVVAARPLLERVVALRALADFGTGVVEQAALATLLATRGLDRHVARLRRAYGARRAALLDALARRMPAGARWTPPAGGHVVWVTLPPGTDPERLHHAARSRGVAYTGGEVFHVDGGGADHLALAFTALDVAAIDDGVARLAAAVRAARGARASHPARGRAPRRAARR